MDIYDQHASVLEVVSWYLAGSLDDKEAMSHIVSIFQED